MRVIMFQPQFHSAIWSGRKKSTIRRRARCKPGDELSLRKWSGRPYGKGTTQIELRSATCKSVTRLTLGISSQGNWWVIRQTENGPELMNQNNLKHLAKIEGFDSVESMRDWFVLNHKLKPGLGMEGEQIQW